MLSHTDRRVRRAGRRGLRENVASVVAFVRLSRPLFLYGGFAGVALGAALAHHRGAQLDLATYLWAQGLVTAFHLMVHYANDYFDRASDVGARRTRWSGGSGVLSEGALAPRVALTAALVCAALGLAATLRFAFAGNDVVAVLGIAILAAAWIYSAPPVRLAARGLGELDATLVVAVLVPATGYAAFTGRVDGTLLAALIAPAAAMFTMMLCVEIPDCGEDLAAGKRTLVVRWGPSVTYNRLAIAVIVTLVLFASTLFDPRLPAWTGLFGLPALLFGTGLAWIIFRGDRRPATVALLGVGLYAGVVSGLAAAYALA
ncbi:MAG TPA: prenyltransferase [Candidatus Limnocylindria bacterium]|nr:prenyltransferase [Candidatus Limnocylindria bacterium]